MIHTESAGTLGMVPSLFNSPRSPLKGDIPNKYPLYKVYMGLIVKGTIPRVPPFSPMSDVRLKDFHLKKRLEMLVMSGDISRTFVDQVAQKYKSAMYLICIHSSLPGDTHLRVMVKV